MTRWLVPGSDKSDKTTTDKVEKICEEEVTSEGSDRGDKITTDKVEKEEEGN